MKREADVTIELIAETCVHCGGALQGAKAKVIATRYEYDLPGQRCVLKKYRQTKRSCPHCGRETIAPFPANITSTQQYGANIRTLAVLLVEYGMVSVARTRSLMCAMLGNPISTGSIHVRIHGQRGRINLGKAGALLARLAKYKVKICRFSYDFNVPFDNNQAERDIRISKVKMFRCVVSKGD